MQPRLNLLILDAGAHPGFSVTLWADRDIDLKFPFQAPSPGHGPVALFGCFVFVSLSGAAFAVFGRRHIYPVFAVGREYAVVPGRVYPRFLHQGSQLGNEIQRLKDDVRGAIAVGCFELIPGYSPRVSVTAVSLIPLDGKPPLPRGMRGNQKPEQDKRIDSTCKTAPLALPGQNDSGIRNLNDQHE